ncbi:ribosome-binding protein aMBF1 (putative translation factor) [Pullulanibacillus pueri]|uniref:Uncharacterized protein n=1 Tax=Pullulanibacillus pueri TaxID=1437324 RepID=A0A8J2ZZL0_9BACL|nr:ribosome-binding protein aMBF1 (putative translation factor) [Pullulanibacillus pueri]GGH86323.1 hypothetical protein GCM10007096_33770 [Pullulanibacillus pueri]
MKVCEVCGTQQTEENDEVLNRRILYVCENCRNDLKPSAPEPDIEG